MSKSNLQCLNAKICSNNFEKEYRDLRMFKLKKKKSFLKLIDRGLEQSSSRFNGGGGGKFVSR